MKKNRFKLNLKSSSNADNKNIRNIKKANTKLFNKTNKSRLEEENIYKDKKIITKKSTLSKINSSVNKDKNKKVDAKSILKEDNYNTNKKEKNKKHIEEEIKSKYNLNLTQKDLKILVTNFELKKNRKNTSLKKFENIINEKLVLKNLTNKRNDLYCELSKISKQNSKLEEESLNNIQIPNLISENSQKGIIKNIKYNKEILLDKISSLNEQIYEIKKLQKINSSINDFSKEEYSENLWKEYIFNNMKNWNKTLNIKRKIVDSELNILNIVKNNSLMSPKQKKNNIKNTILITQDKSNNYESSSNQKKSEFFINNIIKENRNNGYLYQKMSSSYDEKEQKYIKERLKNKFINIKKSNKLDIKYNSLKKKIYNLENLNKLHKMWKERSDLLPKYVSPIYKKIINTEENIKKEEKEKIEKRKLLYELKQNYAKETIKFPPISLILRKDWNKKEIKFNLDKSKGYNNIINNNLNKRFNQLQNRRTSSEKNNNKSLQNSKENKNVKNLNNSNSINKKSHSYIDINNKLNLNINKINNIEKIAKNKYTKLKLENNKDNKKTDIDNIKYQVEVMEDKYKRGKKLLKLKGGYLNNEDLVDEMNELLINSIKGKLNMIEKSNL